MDISEKSFNFKIGISSNSDGLETVCLSTNDCMSLVAEARNICDYGGIWFLEAGPSIFSSVDTKSP